VSANRFFRFNIIDVTSRACIFAISLLYLYC